MQVVLHSALANFKIGSGVVGLLQPSSLSCRNAANGPRRGQLPDACIVVSQVNGQVARMAAPKCHYGWVTISSSLAFPAGFPIDFEFTIYNEMFP